MKLLRNIFLLLLLAATAVQADAQQSSNSGVTRRDGNSGRRGANQGNDVSERMQNHFGANESITDADIQWMRVIYRQLDLNDDKNAALYFPEDLIDGQENLFRIIMRLLCENKINAYEYLDGREIFNDQYKVKVDDMLDRFHILYSAAKGSTEKNPRYIIDESDVPTNEVLSYYIIERWEYDTRTNRMKTYVEAICPVLHRSGDFGGDAVRYPMFWVKYTDLRPYLAQQAIFVSDDNNLPTCNYDDFFNLSMYKGDIYKTRNLRNQSLMQLHSDPEDLKRAQDSIQAVLDNFEKKLWVPDREEVIADKDSKSKKSKKKDESDDLDVSDVVAAATGEAPEKAEADEAADDKAVRKTARSSKSKSSSATKKSSKPKASKPKSTSSSSSSSSAAKSVRKRK